MVLNFEDSMFSHGRRFEDGGGNTSIRQATVVVAKDGTGDSDDIQEAINLLPKGGGVVFIKEGSYLLTTGLTINKDFIKLQGTGNGTEIKTANNIVMLTITSDDVIIDNLLFTGAGTGNTSNNALEINTSNRTKINLCKITECGGDGIDIINGDSTNINQCNLRSNVGSGINIGSDTQGAIIQGNIIIFNEKHGVHINGGDGCIIMGNEISHNDYSNTASFDGIFIENTGNSNQIVSNSIAQNDRYQINISAANCNYTLIMSNYLVTVGTVGGVNDAGTNTHPNGASGTNNLALDDLNILN